MPTKIAMVASDVGLLTALIAPSLLGLTSGLMYDGVDLNVPDGPLATAVTAAMADPNWKISGGKVQLKAYAASVRFNKETGGVTVNSVAYPTDRDTQAKLTGAYSLAQVNPSVSIDWKLPSGGFTMLNAAAITAVATAVGTWVQKCYSAEAAVGVAIDAGTTTTNAQIDAAFAAVS